jgi:ferritin
MISRYIKDIKTICMETFDKFRGKSLKEQNEMTPNLPAETEPVMDLKSPMVKPKTLSSDVESILNERLGDEYAAYYFYRNAANWCKNANYKKAAVFFNSETEGELEHAQGIQDYLTQWNLMPVIPQVPTSQKFANLVDIINKAYELEYNLLMKYSDNQKEFDSTDPATFNFIQKYVDIQNGEVAEYSDFLNALQLVDVNNRLDVLYFENTYF